MTLFLTEPPLGVPVTLAGAKAHMRVETDDEDALIGELVAAAAAHLESAAGLALMTQKWRLCLDAWPRHGPLLIGRSPVTTLDRVTLYDATGGAEQLDPAGAVLDGHACPARLHLPAAPAPGRAMNGIEVDFTAGFGDAAADVPDVLRQAILLHVAHMYAFRGAAEAAGRPADVPAGYDRLIAPFMRRAL